MTMEPKLTRTVDGRYCPVRATLALVGQKWVPHIVHELTGGKRRFNELAASVGGCNSRTLSDRLKALEDLEIVRRTIVATTPPWVEYELTARGRQLAEALAPLGEWGREHLPDAASVDRALAAAEAIASDGTSEREQAPSAG